MDTEEDYDERMGLGTVVLLSQIWIVMGSVMTMIIPATVAKFADFHELVYTYIAVVVVLGIVIVFVGFIHRVSPLPIHEEYYEQMYETGG